MGSTKLIGTGIYFLRALVRPAAFLILCKVGTDTPNLAAIAAPVPPALRAPMIPFFNSAVITVRLALFFAPFLTAFFALGALAGFEALVAFAALRPRALAFPGASPPRV